jgi:hypothetical protein
MGAAGGRGGRCRPVRRLSLTAGLDSKPLGHFVVQEPFARTIGLDPFSIDDKLRDGTLASLLDHFLGGAGGAFDVDFRERKIVLIEEAPGR